MYPLYFQSYGDTGEAFAIERDISRRSTRRRTRTRKTSESRDEPLVKKSSIRIKRQTSRQTSKTTDEPEEIEISEKRLEKLVSPVLLVYLLVMFHFPL